jgi:hypothetical protein
VIDGSYSFAVIDDGRLPRSFKCSDGEMLSGCNLGHGDSCSALGKR